MGAVTKVQVLLQDMPLVLLLACSRRLMLNLRLRPQQVLLLLRLHLTWLRRLPVVLKSPPSWLQVGRDREGRLLAPPAALAQLHNASPNFLAAQRLRDRVVLQAAAVLHPRQLSRLHSLLPLLAPRLPPTCRHERSRRRCRSLQLSSRRHLGTRLASALRRLPPLLPTETGLLPLPRLSCPLHSAVPLPRNCRALPRLRLSLLAAVLLKA